MIKRLSKKKYVIKYPIAEYNNSFVSITSSEQSDESISNYSDNESEEYDIFENGKDFEKI